MYSSSEEENGAFNHFISPVRKENSGDKPPCSALPAGPHMQFPLDRVQMDYRTNGTESSVSPLNCENVDAATQKLNFGDETQLLEEHFDFLLNTEENTQVVDDGSDLETEEGTECTVVISGDERDSDDYLTDIESARLPNAFPSNEQSVSGASTKTTSPQGSTKADLATPIICERDDPEMKTFNVACGVRDEADKPKFSSDDSSANRDELVSTSSKQFGLSYANSEEPGEATQENALDCVQKLIDDSDILINNESTSSKNFNGGTRVTSAVKGPQSLAKMANVSSNSGSGGVYEWDDRFEDEGGGEIFARRKDEFFGLAQKTSKKQSKIKSNDGRGDVESRKRVTSKVATKKSGRSSMADVGVDTQVATEVMESLANGDPILHENSSKNFSRRRRASISDESKKISEMPLRSLRSRTVIHKSSAKKLLKDKKQKAMKETVLKTDQSSRGKHFEKDLMISESKGVVTRSKREKYNISQDGTKKNLFCKVDKSEESSRHSSIANPISGIGTMVSPVAKRTRRSMNQLSGLLNNPEIAPVENTCSPLNDDGSSVIPKSNSKRKGHQRIKKCEDSSKQYSANEVVSHVAKRTRRSMSSPSVIMLNTPKTMTVENTITPSVGSDSYVIPTSVPKRKGSQRTQKGDISLKQHSEKDSINAAIADASGKVSIKNNGILTSTLVSKDTERNAQATSPSTSNLIPESELLNTRKRRDLSSVRVLFSNHLDDDILQQQKKLIERLSINMASSISEATHFIADKFIRTKNMLEAIACGKQIVTHQWLQHVAQANYLIDEKNYILRDAKKEKQLRFNMSLSLEHSRHHNLLQGLRVFVSPNAKPNKATVSALVKADHGNILEEDGRTLLNNPAFCNDLLVLSCEEDYAYCLPFLERGIAVYSSELLLNGILSRKLEFGRYRLFSGQSKRRRILRSGIRT